MSRLSAFADEISPDLREQFDALTANGVGSIELRGVGGKGVLELTEAELRDVLTQASDRGVTFSAIGSPLGKFPLDGDFGEQLDGLKKALSYAQIVGAPYIRLFSFHIPKGDDPASHRTQVMDWLGQMVAEAEKTSVVLAHENEKGIYGDTGERCLDIHQTIVSDSFGAIFDFSNYVQCGERPYEDCWLKVKQYVRYFHIKDAMLESGNVVPAGRGDGDVAKILAEAFAMAPDWILSLEPHLSEEYGATGAERFGVAADGLKEVLAALGSQ